MDKNPTKPKAQFNLALSYVKGSKPNYKKAAEWFDKAAQQGLDNAQFNLGHCYKHGQGVELNPAKAFYWYTRAATQGHANAQLSVGVCYFKGEGVITNYDLATYWYKKSADKGNKLAQFNLGSCYKNGQGVASKDLDQAIHYFELAAKQGDKAAKLELKTIKEEEELKKNTIEAQEYMLKALNNDEVDGYTTFLNYNPTIFTNRIFQIDSDVFTLTGKGRLELKNLIGNGAFGSLFKCEWNTIRYAFKQPAFSTELTKCQIPDLTLKQIQQLLTDVGPILRIPRHPNVIQMFGFCLNPLGLLSEFTDGGDLHTHLTSIRTAEKPVPLGNVVGYLSQIVQGMQHLHFHNIIHRCLCAKNVLMCAQTSSCKIGDYGLSRRFNSIQAGDRGKSAFVSGKFSKTAKEDGATLPLEWLAPEATHKLKKLKYSEKTDVWSFGVLMWEIFSGGMHPCITSTSAATMRQAVMQGERLSKPVYCPESLWKIALDCWSIDPQNRPTFEKISEQITECVEDLNSEQFIFLGLKKFDFDEKKMLKKKDKGKEIDEDGADTDSPIEMEQEQQSIEEKIKEKLTSKNRLDVTTNSLKTALPKIKVNSNGSFQTKESVQNAGYLVLEENEKSVWDELPADTRSAGVPSRSLVEKWREKRTSFITERNYKSLMKDVK